MSTYDLVADRRLALADALDELDDDQWRAPSLCEGWQVRHVVGHLQLPWAVPLPKLVLAVVRHRGYDAANLRLSRELGERPTATLVGDLRANARSTRGAPGMPPEALLADVMVHSQDILVPLGLSLPAPADATMLVLDFAVSKKGKGLHPPGGIDGLRFRATDLAWSHGDGAEVAGEGLDLAAALLGRPALADRLSGEGVRAFRQRFG